jgi:hypothetical protein
MESFKGKNALESGVKYIDGEWHCSKRIEENGLGCPGGWMFVVR